MMQQSRELMQKYHLNDVLIIPEAEQEGQLNESIARAGAMASPTASAKTRPSTSATATRLSRTLNHLATMVKPRHLHLSLTGGVSYYPPNGRSNIFNARLYLMPAPLLASSHEDGGGDARGGLRQRNHPHGGALLLHAGGHRRDA